MFANSQVLIRLSARGLRITKDPKKHFSTRCVLLASNELNGDFAEIDKTEFSDDSINPDWDKKFMIAFKFSSILYLKFDVYQSLEKVGETKISLTELVSARDGFTMKTLKKENIKIGKLLITYEEVETTKEALLMQFSGKDLDKKDLFGLSDPYLVISNVDRNGNLTQVYKSEAIKQNVSPVWQPIKIRAKTLCQCDRQMKLQFDCFDWDSDIKGSKIDRIGSFATTLEQLLVGPSDDNTYECINETKLANNLDTYKNSGLICLDKISVVKEKSLLDYLRNGTQFHAKIAVDFTSALVLNNSNDKNKSNSSNNENIYNLFIRKFCQILEQYNRQNIWSVSGFNAIFAENESNDYYELRPNELSINVESLITTITSELGKVKPLAKSTNKGINIETTINNCIEWIDTITSIKTDMNSKDRYFILLMLTSDLNKETLKNIEDISDQINSNPFSIIILDINLNENNKEFRDYITLMNEKKKSNKRNNIEIISIQNIIQSNDWNKFVTKTGGDILNHIPDHYMKYINLVSEQQK